MQPHFQTRRCTYHLAFQILGSVTESYWRLTAYFIGLCRYNPGFYSISTSTSLFFATPIMSTDLRAGRQTRQDDLLSLKHLSFEYRCFEIMHYIEMEMYGNLFVPLHTLIYILIIFPLAILIQHSSHMDNKTIIIILNRSVGFCIFWGTTLRFGGYYFAQNVKTLRSWGKLDLSCGDKLYMRKFVKSCKPLQIGDQARFKFTKLSILFFIRGISRGVVRVLLTSNWLL